MIISAYHGSGGNVLKKNLPVTQVERFFPDNERLVSETDLRGIVTVANASFCEVAGFSPEELVGKSHNLVRHPDMPPEAFADMWRTIQVGERWVGIVKNRCKNGDHYWVKAFVSPVSQDGQIIRYRSVRKRPTRDEIGAAEELYRRVQAGEKGLIDTARSRQQQTSLGKRLRVGQQLSLVTGLPLLLSLMLLAGASAGLSLTVLWGLAALGGLAAAGFTWSVYRWQTEPLSELDRAMRAFEQGNLNARVELYGDSQFAKVASTMNSTLDGVEVALAETGQLLTSLEKGVFGRRIVATLPGELNQIKRAANRATEQMEVTVTALNSRLAGLAAGRLEVQDSTQTGAEGEFRAMQEHAQAAAGQLATLLRAVVGSARAMARGDLTQAIETSASGELEEMAIHFNGALIALGETLVSVRDDARHVADVTHEISGAVEEIAAGATNQMVTVQDVTSSLQQSSQTLSVITEDMASASLKSQAVVQSACAGRMKMEQMVSAVHGIADSSQKISLITNVIGEIASKTNLLALNAAIEAARAGEHGRGFAVVAAEVGQLAESSARSAKEIAHLVGRAVNDALGAAQSVSAVTEEMHRIAASAQESSEMLARTAVAMEQQRAALAGIEAFARELTAIAQGNAAATEELAASAEQMAQAAASTYHHASKFKVTSAS